MMPPTAWAARWVMEDPQLRDFFVLDGDVLTALLLCGAALWFLIVWATASVRRFEATSMGTADAIDALPLRERSVASPRSCAARAASRASASAGRRPWS